MMPLGLLNPGDSGEIAECSTGKEVRVEDMGLRVGKSVKTLTTCGRLILVKVDESRIAIPREIAMK